MRLKKAYDDFFRRVKNGEQPGYPRFQGPNRYDSFTYPDGAGWKLDAKERKPDKKGIVRVNLKLTKIGTVKLHLHRTIQGTIKTLTIKREGEHFYAVFTCEIGKPEPLPISYEDVGIDLGVTHFAALSNGAAAKAGLNKSILDAGWSTLTEMESVKAAWAGRTVVFVNPFMTSQLC